MAAPGKHGAAAGLSRRGLAAYAAFALPLAMAALPVYVHAPKFYAELGLNLTLIGALLLAVRTLDALIDPLLGFVADRVSRRLVMALATPLIALGMVLLFNPPAGAGMLAGWFAGALILVYLGLSAATISYFAAGSALSRDYHERTLITAVRGMASLTGVLAAAALPEYLAALFGRETGLSWFSIGFVPLLVVAAVATLVWTPAPAVSPVMRRARFELRSVLQPFANARYRRLAAVFLVNGIAAAIPATLILFFVADIIQAVEYTGLFLVVYFLSGAAGMPLWVRWSRVIGKTRTWAIAMALSVVAFVWAFALGAGDVVAFAVVCALSGLAFGADLALPASLLADVIDRDERAGGGRPDGAYFGMWHLLEKLALAIAAGTALPLLDALGYQPGATGGATALAATYALLPCAIKLAAAWLLWRSALEPQRGVAPLRTKEEST
ncbi:MAG: MFS transporter [Burkholderiales bacterium]|nr:MFS transporter [Burkholderiales bacterium]